MKRKYHFNKHDQKKHNDSSKKEYNSPYNLIILIILMIFFSSSLLTYLLCFIEFFTFNILPLLNFIGIFLSNNAHNERRKPKNDKFIQRLAKSYFIYFTLNFLCSVVDSLIIPLPIIGNLFFLFRQLLSFTIFIIQLPPSLINYITNNNNFYDYVINTLLSPIYLFNTNIATNMLLSDTVNNLSESLGCVLKSEKIMVF